MKLFCIPYAGGSSTMYYAWRKLIHPSITLIPLELSGRGSRMGQPFYNSIADEGTTDLLRSMEQHLDGSPIALFGHSMGTLFTYELAHRLHQVTGQSPAHLFFSGRGAPHTAKKGAVIHGLPDAEFQNEVLQLGGTPLDLFAHKELSDIYMPILRSDYRLVETYQDTGKKQKLDCDITILWGNRDRYTREEAKDWGIYTNGDSRFMEYDGGHFFINEQPQKVIDTIHSSLLGQRSIIHH